MSQQTNFDLLEPSVLPAGTQFGGYIIRECIGQGAMGSVYRAEHAVLGKAVALKVMAEGLLTSAEARQRFLREGQAAAAVRHPNVVDITDIGMHRRTPYLVMELLEGEDLERYLERHDCLGEHEIAALALPIVAALGAAHERGVVHRDLKPSNIFLARGPAGEIVPKVLDFGVSKLGVAVATTNLESTPIDRLLGSPLYLPPEAVTGAQCLTAKSDQYSLGVLLYRCTTGRLPFAGETLLALLNAISAGDFAPPSQLRPTVSSALERAILRAMSPDPVQRFEDIRELGSALLDVADLHTRVLWGGSFAVDGLGHSRVTAATPRAARRLWASALLGMIVLAAILVATRWSVRSTPEATRVPFASLPPPSEAALTRALEPTMAVALPAHPGPLLGEAEPGQLPVVRDQQVPQAATGTPEVRHAGKDERDAARQVNASAPRGSRSAPAAPSVGANESPILD